MRNIKSTLLLATCGSSTRLATTKPLAIPGAATPTFASSCAIAVAVEEVPSPKWLQRLTMTDLATTKSNSIKTNRAPTRRMAVHGLFNTELDRLEVSSELTPFPSETKDPNNWTSLALLSDKPINWPRSSLTSLWMVSLD